MIKKTITILACILIAASAFSQTSVGNKTTNVAAKPTVDSVALWNDFLDSALRHTSINAFQHWLYENATVKQYNESKFVDLYNAYVQYQMQLFLKPKDAKK